MAYTKFYSFVAMFALYAGVLSYTQHYTDKQGEETTFKKRKSQD